MGKLQRPRITEKLMDAAAKRGGAVTTQFVLTALQNAPVENGHTHEALLMAVSKAGIEKECPAALGLQTRFGAVRSRDPEAAKRGMGARRHLRNYIVRLTINLPFAATLNRGGTIRPGDLAGRKGRKISPDFPGPLYGPRTTEGRGVLMWRQGGQIMRARVRSVPAYNFWQKAAYAARIQAARLGLREK